MTINYWQLKKYVDFYQLKLLKKEAVDGDIQNDVGE